MLTREELLQIQRNLETAYKDAASVNRAEFELREIMDSIRIVIRARQSL